MQRACPSKPVRDGIQLQIDACKAAHRMDYASWRHSCWLLDVVPHRHGKFDTWWEDLQAQGGDVHVGEYCSMS